MCQNPTAIFSQLINELGVSSRHRRPTSEAEAEALAARVVDAWTKDPRRIRSAYGALSGATNEARRLAALPESHHRRLASAMVAKMDEVATEDLKKSRQFGEIIVQLTACLTPRQAAKA